MMKIVTDPSAAPETIYFLSPDVTEAFDLVTAACVMKRHGLVPQVLVDKAIKAAMDTVEKAGKEKRIAVITNVGLENPK